MSPTSQGLRAVWRQPAVFFAELIWRWSWGAASLVVLLLCAVRYLHALHVTGSELAALRSNSAPVAAEAVQQIFAGSGPLLLHLLLFAAPAIARLWWAAATVGRTVTLRALMPAHTVRFSTQSTLHLLRALNSLVALAALGFSAYAAGLVSIQGDQPNPALFILVFLLLAVLVIFIRGAINYFLALASVIAAENSLGSARSISAAVAFFRRHTGAMTWLELAIGFWKFVAAVVISVLSLIPALLADVARGAVAATLLVLLTLLNFFLADFLNLARIAAWIAVAQQDRASAAAQTKTAGAVTPAV